MVFLMRHRLLLIPGIVFSCGAVWSSAQPADPSAPSSSAPVAAAESRTYQVRKGDTFEGIARRCGCSVRELIELNGLKPTTVLQIGMPLKLPTAQVNEAPSAALPAEGTHTIAKGESFAVLAKKYGIPSSELLAANPGVNPTKLQIGQVVKLRRDVDPDATAATSAPDAGEPPASADAAVASATGSTSPAVDETAETDPPSSPAATESAAPAPEPAPPPVAIVVQEDEIDSSATHTVRKGDTFATIAKKHRVSVRQIEQVNPGVKSNRLKIGQTLRIQLPKAAPKEEPKEKPKPTAPPVTAEAAPPSSQSPEAAAAPSTPTPAAATTEPPAPAVVSTPPPAPTNETASNATAVTSPPPAPPSAAAPAAPSPRAIESRNQVLRRVSEPMTFGEFAASQGCTVEELNALNGYNMTPDSILSAAAEVLVPLPPDTDP